MPRYFFRISDGKPYRDETGEELRDELDARKAAKRLTRDIEDGFEPNEHWSLDVSDAVGPLYSITITARKLR